MANLKKINITSSAQQTMTWQDLDMLDKITPTSDSDINATINTNGVYRDTKDSLESKYSSININTSNIYIRFVDNNVESILSNSSRYNSNSSDPITQAEVNNITYFDTVFRSNTTITKFPEFEYFTNCITLNGQCFYGCSNLTELKLPSSIKYMTAAAFSGCTKLASEINLPNFVGVSSTGRIYDQGFYNCQNLPSFKVGNSVKIIGDASFYNCYRLTTFEIGTGCTQILNNAFKNCIRLSSFTIRATTPPTFGTGGATSSTGAFSGAGTSTTLSIYVPSSAVDTYKTASGWSNLSSKIYAIPE